MGKARQAEAWLRGSCKTAHVTVHTPITACESAYRGRQAGQAGWLAWRGTFTHAAAAAPASGSPQADGGPSLAGQVGEKLRHELRHLRRLA